MLYVPLKVYPNQQSLKGCMSMAILCLGLATAGFHLISHPNLRVAVYSICMAGFAVSMINIIAVMRRQPMIKILDDRFSVYTPFGYVLIRFGEVLIFRKGRMPFFNTMRIEINRSARPRYPSGFGRLLNAVVRLNFSNKVTIPGFMLGADPDSVVQLLEKRRLAAVRLEAIGGYDPTAVTTVG
ncbi:MULTISPECIES: hypothetical protein [unclassified Pseudodesulfovibrio]|uniref:hypothetical protein n=1 Tax=unclassified Pseudodesulfovibrio TaxID=2661612 RepID=UPI000FEB7CFB|nr:MULTISPECIES: hypothetical protein [unclassified Pseudodesulfovibrio]MCJ2163149.1 hypothetical protein [Pseudodesulfovibrio sp. S3-i]RWU07140.1 hypothetical protein DWB63_01130 [Pseudodesulfovibrio sp. S3]